MTEADKVSPPRPDPANQEQDEIIDDLVPDVPADTPPRGATSRSVRHGAGGQGLVHSDLVGAAEPSSEYAADHAGQQTESPATETREAWREARDDWDEEKREPGDPRGPR